MTKRKPILPEGNLSAIISSSHVRTVYNTRKAVVTVNSIFDKSAPYSKVLQNLILQQCKMGIPLEFQEKSRYNKIQQNVAGAPLCDLRRTS